MVVLRVVLLHLHLIYLKENYSFSTADADFAEKIGYLGDYKKVIIYTTCYSVSTFQTFIGLENGTCKEYATAPERRVLIDLCFQTGLQFKGFPSVRVDTP